MHVLRGVALKKCPFCLPQVYELGQMVLRQVCAFKPPKRGYTVPEKKPPPVYENKGMLCAGPCVRKLL